MDTTKKDLQPYKNNLMQLSYNEKIDMSEWLHTQIDAERNQAVKEKAAKVSGQLDNFLAKAAEKTKGAANGMLDAFRSATSSSDNIKGPEQR